MSSGRSRGARHGLVAAALALAALATPATSRAAPAAAPPTAADLARARALFAQGEAAAAGERWVVAIERFESVRAIKETPGVVFHLAAAHEGAGHLAEALALFERARDLARSGGVADVLALADGRIAALGHRVPRIVVRVPRPDESRDVLLDGTPLPAARWGEPVRVDPGEHRVEASHAGEPFVRDLSLVEGAWITVVIGDPGSPAVEVPGAPAGPAPAAPAGLPATGLASEPAPSPAPTGGLPWGPIALGAGGLALAAGGVVTFAVAGAESTAAAEACAAGGASCDPGARDTVRTLDAVSLGLWIGGAAALGGAVVWWRLGDDDGDAALAARLGPAGGAVSGRF